MYQVNSAIVRVYQFFGEAILFFFIMLGIFLFFDIPYPTWEYIIFVIVIGLIYATLAHFAKTYLPYILIVPIIAIGLIYLINLPLIMGIIFTGFIYWRFIEHIKDANHEHEQQLIIFSLPLAIIFSLSLKDNSLLWMGLLQFCIVLFGYMFSHMFVITSREDRKKVSTYRYPLFLLGIFAVSATVFTLIFDSARVVIGAIWLFFAKIPIWIFMQFMVLLEAMGFDVRQLSNSDEVQGLFENMKPQQEQGSQGTKQPQAYQHGDTVDQIIDTTYWIVIGVVVLMIIISAVIIYKKKVNQEKLANESKNDTTYRKIESVKKSEESLTSKLYNRFFNKLDHPARQAFLEFERFATKKGVGRNHSETIEDWFNRINLPIDRSSLYQAVRYGNKHLSKEELIKFKEQLKELKELIK